MKRVILFIFFLWGAVQGYANDEEPLFKRVINGLYSFVKDFSRVDTTYIEPQHYNFQVMLQNTNTYEVYRLQTKNGVGLTLAPRPTYKLGPYVGWRWIFLGYTFDLTHIDAGNNKREFDLSFYSSKIGIDLFYRKTGNNYKIRSLFLGDGINTDQIDGTPFDGFSASIKGFNIYYIFNHRKFSYPAAFSQSTVQRRSYGSALLGVGYTKHSLSLDWERLNQVINDRLDNGTDPIQVDSGLISAKVKYTDFSASGGYAYNWVFAHNWLFAASLSLALGYKSSYGNIDRKLVSLRNFSFSNFNLDGVGRFGIVWNNTKWYLGSSAIFHTYNYRKQQFSANTFFGNLNLYVGFNFNRKK